MLIEGNQRGEGGYTGIPSREPVHIPPVHMENHRLKSALGKGDMWSFPGGYHISVFVPKKFVTLGFQTPCEEVFVPQEHT